MAVQVLLLLALSSNIHAEVIKKAQTDHRFLLDDTADFCSVSRWSSEGKELLWNSSDTYYLSDSLAVSHSGRYQEQCWTRGNLTLDSNTTLLVCAGTNETTDRSLYPNVGETVEMMCEGVGPNQSIQWVYKSYEHYDSLGLTSVDDDTPFEYEHQQVKNKPSLRLTVNRPSIDISYYCLERQQLRCDIRGHFYVRATSEIVFRSVGESLELKCSDGSRNQTHMWRKANSLGDDIELLNSPLVLPSLTLAHTGYYSCDHSAKNYQLLVCPEPEPPAVELFSEGENLTLHCRVWNQTHWVTWFLRSNRTEERVLHVYQYHQLDNAYLSGSNLVIRNVSLLDTGQVWCVVRKESVCVFRSEFQVRFREPGMDHHLLRSVLLSAVVLMMLSVVGGLGVGVWRSRRGAQVPAPVEELEMSQLSPESDVQEETPV